MSKNEEKGRENSKPQRKINKLTEVNKKRKNNNERPLSEGRKPDISKTFPNFSALTESEKLIFFQALTTARKNVEERGVPTRQCFGTVHDEYLKYFNEKQKESKEVLENAKETSYFPSNSVVRDNSKSSSSNKSKFKPNPRDFSSEKSQSSTSKNLVTNRKGNNKLITDEPGHWDHCESIIQKNTEKVIDLYLKKKERNEAKFNNIQFTNEKSVKNLRSKTPEVGKKRNAEEGRKKTESLGTRTMAKKTLKVRNTSKFDALNAEEKEIFFRTLQEAHDNVVEKNPEKEGEILPLSAIMKRYKADRPVTANFTTSQEPLRREEGRRNLRVKVILTSGDNERLSKTKSQVLSDAMRKVSDRRHKSAESLLVECKKPSSIDDILDKEVRPKSSFYKHGVAVKDSLEIYEKSTSKLNRHEKTIKFEEIKEKEKEREKREKKKCEEFLKPRKKDDKKFKRKEKKSSCKCKKLKTTLIPTCEPKISEKLKIKNCDSLVTAKKKKVKGSEKEFKTQKKKPSKKKMKKEQEKEELEKEEELFNHNLLSDSKENAKVHQKKKKSEGSTVIQEQCEMEEEKCQIKDSNEMDENCEKDSFDRQAISGEINGSEINCEGDLWELESEEDEKMVNETGECDEIVNEEEEQKMECLITCETEGGKAETLKTFEQVEEQTLKVTSGSLRSVTTQEIELLDSNLSINPSYTIVFVDPDPRTKEESTIAVKSLILYDANVCETEIMNTPLESDQEKPESVVMKTQKEITAEANMLQEVFKETSFLQKKPREEKKTEETPPDKGLGKVMSVDDSVIEKVKKLIFYLETKIQKNDHLEEEHLQLIMDYVDYLSKVLECVVLREERPPIQNVVSNFRDKILMQVQKAFTAAGVRLKFDDTNPENQEKENAPPAKKDSIPRSVSEQEFKRMLSEGSVSETKTEKPEKKLDEEVPAVIELESSSDSEAEVHFAPINSEKKKVLTTNIRLLQDLLQQRAEFVEGSIADFKIVHHPEAEDFVPIEKPPTIQFIADEDEENMQQDHKMKFFRTLLKCCLCGKKKTEEDGMFENLKGEAVKADLYDERQSNNPASATLNQSTMEVLKAAERKKIIEKYYSQE